jgi:hypothetical protein
MPIEFTSHGEVSPWLHSGPSSIVGRILHVQALSRVSDISLYFKTHRSVKIAANLHRLKQGSIT